jgi:hypothetical protein
MSDPRTLRWLGSRGGWAPGRGLLWTFLVLLAQCIVAASAHGSHELPRPTSTVLTLAAHAVVQPPLGIEPGAVDDQPTWPVGSRLQLTFEGAQDGWTAALWLSGDTVTSLYPNPAAGESGWTSREAYVVPGEGQWLRLTATPAEGDLLAIVSDLRPVAEVQRALDDPSPANVRALRSFLERRSQAWVAGPSQIERYLPTADGRAIPVAWTPVRGAPPLVRAWAVHAD